MHSRYFWGFIGMVLLLLSSIQGCKKDQPLPPNPYDSIDRGDTTADGIPIDSLTITYVHHKVLASKCALPGCHDGNFEPDFRTVQSSYSTLVYAPVLKNDTAGSFAFRVIPRDTSFSVLYERITNCCFVNANDRMPQDNIGVALPDSSIRLIADWIMYGAKDMFGNSPAYPNSEPTIQYYSAFDTLSLIPPFAFPSVFYANNRLDSIFYNPFIVPVSKTVFYALIKVADDSTAEGQMQLNKLKISTHADNFTAAQQFTATYLNVGGQSGWVVTIPTASLPANDTLFMRYYVNDGDHAANTEFPRSELPFAYKTYWSFIRQ
ncbi:MAG: hypothetical protein U0T74_02770 [Chitinophagales bacterium]